MRSIIIITIWNVESGAEGLRTNLLKYIACQDSRLGCPAKPVSLWNNRNWTETSFSTIQNKILVLVVLVLYQNSQFRCFYWTETKIRTTETNQNESKKKQILFRKNFSFRGPHSLICCAINLKFLQLVDHIVIYNLYHIDSIINMSWGTLGARKKFFDIKKFVLISIFELFIW